MYQNYVEILGKPCKWEPTPELRWGWSTRDDGDKNKKVLQQLWKASHYDFFGSLYSRTEWRDVPET